MRAAAAALLLAVALPGAAQPLRIEATVEPGAATVGDRLHLTVRLERAEGVAAPFPSVAGAIAPFEVLSEVIRPVEEAGGRVVETRDYLIAAFRTGELWVPRIPFVYVSAAGDTVEAFTDSIRVTIESVVPDTLAGGQLAPRDIKPPVELPREWWRYAVAAAAAAAAYLAYRCLRKWWRARRAGPARLDEAPPVPREAAHEVAFARLRALEADDPLGRGEIARFYDTLSDILRLYLGDRYAVRAIDMTTEELGPAMTGARMEPADADWTVRFLGHADLAKFAKHVPTIDRGRGDLRGAWDFVERTRFRGEAPAEDAPAAAPPATGAPAATDGGAAAC